VAFGRTASTFGISSIIVDTPLLRATKYPIVAAVIASILMIAADYWGPFVVWLWLRRGPAEFYSVLVSLAFSAYAGWRVIACRVGGWVVAGLAGVAVLVLAQFLGQGSVLLGVHIQNFRANAVPSFVYELNGIAFRVALFAPLAFVSGLVGGALRRWLRFSGVANT
jgi:hypothetical protein